MKIRSDFVSNSSSSSYLIAIDFNKYDFDLFVKNVCDNCDEFPDSNKDVRRRNEAILRYCLEFNELLFLGTLLDGRKKEIYKRGCDYDGKAVTDPNELAITPFAQMFEDYKHGYYNDSTSKVTLIDNDTIEYEYDNELTSRITVLSQYMTDYIRDSWRDSKNPTTKRKNRVKKILNIVHREGSDSELWRSPYSANTYKITLNTIENTRDMLAEGLMLEFEKWESNLDALEARVASGETIFYIECGDAGEGEDDTRLYSLQSQYPFTGIPYETINSDY